MCQPCTSLCCESCAVWPQHLQCCSSPILILPSCTTCTMLSEDFIIFNTFPCRCPCLKWLHKGKRKMFGNCRTVVSMKWYLNMEYIMKLDFMAKLHINKVKLPLTSAWLFCFPICKNTRSSSAILDGSASVCCNTSSQKVEAESQEQENAVQPAFHGKLQPDDKPLLTKLRF